MSAVTEWAEEARVRAFSRRRDSPWLIRASYLGWAVGPLPLAPESPTQQDGAAPTLSRPTAGLGAPNVERGVLRLSLGATNVERGVLRLSLGATNLERGVLRSFLAATNVERGVLR